MKTSRRSLILGGVGLAALPLLVYRCASAGPVAVADERRPNAPEFPADAAWLNTDRPLTLRALRGKIVLLDFWTYGCINCIHILPDLKRLERKYASELVVIGVHSAKFENEDETPNIRNAVLRYNIEHPVLNDRDMRVWESFGVNAWPTFVLIDPAGNVVGTVSGEGNHNVLDRAIQKTVNEFKEKGTLDTTPAKYALEAAKVPNTPLWYPGKVLADDAGKRLFIADTNHNRIVITDLSGKVDAVVGSGVADLKDGPFTEAAFRNPQGMALRTLPGGGQALLVADTGNHALRSVDLSKGIVSTIAGTGKQAEWRSRGGVGTTAALASPWDLLRIDDTLYIAMAGPHQIWSMDLVSQRVGPFAGSGREARIDGPRDSAGFAQPSGLATDGKRLYVADSEISAIRAIDLPGQGESVRTIAGGDLFEFGDRDGAGDAVRLQHPLAVAYNGDRLFIADTYNHKIKTLNPDNGYVRSWLGKGRGDRDGTEPQFYEPGGLSLAGGKLYVADTNNHRIRVIDIAAEKVTTLPLKDVPPPLSAEPDRSVRPAAADGAIVLAPVTLAPGAGDLVLDVKLPPNHKLAVEAPQRVQARVEGTGLSLLQKGAADEAVKLPLRLKFQSGKEGKGTAHLSASIYYCPIGGKVCKVKTLRFRAPYQIKEGGAKQIVAAADLK